MEPRSRLLDQSIETAIVYSIACGVGCKVVDRQGNSYVEEKNDLRVGVPPGRGWEGMPPFQSVWRLPSGTAWGLLRLFLPSWLS